ncbi:SufBD protein [Desulfurococcus amylolyticus 1221n]|uniref:Type II methyltransferase n=1 Tax=Desulfurococcus amylolyticus (strain DSM 18924 / JCM 16383 / VKM B-2413 / 1221n) TaxID=490899 RepID=B8D603_DESA1|nr:SufBD protein [Desulfurococcus amylolyticus 1221n]
MYTRPGDVVLDPMVGSGTTLIEAKLLGRNSIDVDINYNAVMLALHRLYYLEKALADYLKRLGERAGAGGGGAGPAFGDATPEDVERTWYKVYHGDARRLSLLESESVDLVATHPPYFNIIEYGGAVYLNGDEASAEVVSKALAREEARVVTRGRLHARGRGSKGHLECRGLMLSEKAYMLAVPELSSDTLDATLTHEASIGRLAEEEVNYLVSKGFKRDEAVSLLVKGFISVEENVFPPKVRGIISSVEKLVVEKSF